MIETTMAAIPAAIVVSIIVTLIGFLLSAIFGTGFVTFMGHGISV